MLSNAPTEALPTAQKFHGLGKGVSLVRDVALVSTVVSVPVLFGVVALLA